MNHLLYLGLVAGLILSVYDQNFNADKQETDIGSYSLNIPVTLVLLFAIYFGYNTIQSEIYISRAQKLKDSPIKKEFARMAKLGNRPLVPFEPRYSFPVINYSGLADYVYDHNNEKALKVLKRAYRQHPSNFAVINNVGSVYGEMGRYDSSIAYYYQNPRYF
ncbi:MAG: tetratricopeptide repeat protein [Bacteroidales bacterium]